VERKPRFASAPWCGALLACAACASLPARPAEQALYVDLRKIVEVAEDAGWTVDRTRIEQNGEAALHSACQVTPEARVSLQKWLSEQIAAAGGPAEQRFRAGSRLDAIEETLALERTLALLQYAQAHAANDCPFWLRPDATFRGEQGDYGHLVILGETQAFGTVAVPGPIPALGGGGRILVGGGVTRRLTLALGADLAASGTFVPSSSSQGVDAYMTLAAPTLIRLLSFSRIYELELAPVMRFSHGDSAWPPGARVEVGFGYAGVRTTSWMSYFMFYAGYEVHGRERSAIDHTFQLGTKLSIDWLP
jgi:hypothetical protein